MTCTSTCRKPSPSQAHCGACHVTFGGVGGFDRHRRDDRCLTPAEIGHTDNGTGVFRVPSSEADRLRLAYLRRIAPYAVAPEPQSDETGSGVLGDTPSGSKPADSPSGGSA